MFNALSEQAETVVMPVIGYRAWKVDTDNRLCSHLWHVHWPIRQRMVAACHIGIGGCQYSGTNGSHYKLIRHHCGIYAFKTEALLLAYMQEEAEKSRFFPASMYTDKRELVSGSVYLWGKVVECNNGYRATYAYPKEICESPWSAVEKPRLEQVAEMYGVSCAWQETDLDRYRLRAAARKKVATTRRAALSHSFI